MKLELCIIFGILVALALVICGCSKDTKVFGNNDWCWGSNFYDTTVTVSGIYLDVNSFWLEEWREKTKDYYISDPNTHYTQTDIKVKIDEVEKGFTLKEFARLLGFDK